MQPPKKVLMFLRWFCREDCIEEIEGDLTELFEKKYVGDSAKAKWKFTWSVIRYFRPEFIKSFKASYKLNTIGMFRHNLLLSYRNFKRYKSSFFINLIGLSTGLASALLIYLWVNDELNVDKFHEKDSQLYQVMQNFHFRNGIQTYGFSPALLAKALLEEMPEVEQTVTINYAINSKGILSIEEKHIEASGLYGSKDFFQIFSYNLILGDSEQLLTDQNAIVLSEELALKLFGTLENIVGKIIEGNRDLFEETFLVTGVFENPPFNSTAQFDFIINFEMAFANIFWINEWTGDGAKTYITLKEGTNIDYFNEKLKDYLKSKHPSRQNNILFVRQYSKGYLYGEYENGVQVGGRIVYVKLLSIMAVFILLVACINFMNLSTAQASRKMKEVGVKKTLGISRKSLVVQFLGESMLLTFLSFVIAVLLIALLLPQFNEITRRSLHLNIDSGVILSIAGIALIAGFLSGIYPAFYLSGFKPATVLKGNLKTSFGELWARRGLVIIQFTISVIFIVGFLVINNQIEFIQTTDLGYNRENVIQFTMRGSYNRETFMSELKHIPGVANATNTSSGSIVEMQGTGTGFSWGGSTDDEEIQFRRPHIGYDFIETLGIEVIAGRAFSRDYGNESSKLMINEAAAKIIGLEDIVGRTIMDSDKEKQIIGVVKNFKIKSLHEKMHPCIMRFWPNGNDIMVKLDTKTESATIELIEELYNSFHPEYPFVFTFIDDDYQALYLSEQRVAVLSNYFMAIAIIISCLGLFGLAAFATERRTKEIGIRKILGSSDFGIVRMLSGDFTKLVIAAIIISLPISYLIVKNWLDNFAYRIDLEWWYFIGTAFFALLIAWFTVGLQTIKAARINPVKCLRDE